MRRDFLLMPTILLYMATLLFAAWPSEIRPAAFSQASFSAKSALATVGLRAGMSVFRGSPEKMETITLGRCVLVEGFDVQGRSTQLNPTETCFKEGFRWKPVAYQHMLLHWMVQLQVEPSPPILRAYGVYFCAQAEEHAFVSVLVTEIRRVLDYETGHRVDRSIPVGRVRCKR